MTVGFAFCAGFGLGCLLGVWLSCQAQDEYDEDEALRRNVRR